MTRLLSTIPELDPYELLQVSRDASLAEIRRAYRKQLIEVHPDKNPDRSEWSERRIRELLQAFDILGDPDKRREYDMLLRARLEANKPKEDDLFFFRKNDLECLALRVLYFLVHMRGDEAAELVDQTESDHGPTFLREQLDRSDYLDCLFLLGEHYMRKRQYIDALERFLILYRDDARSRFRRHYFDLVVEHLKTLYMRYLPKVLGPEELIDRLEGAVSVLNWSRREAARLYLVVAKQYKKLNRLKHAHRSLDKALAADPNFSKAKRWREELVMS